MAQFEGKSLSESVREAVLNLYEDEYDAHVADASLEEYEKYLAGGGDVLSWKDLLDEVDLKNESTDYSYAKIQKQLAKLDKFTKKQIVCWLEKNIEGSDNPKIHGKALVGDRTNQWRYRIGDYRVIVNINDQELIVLALEIGHRRKIY